MASRSVSMDDSSAFLMDVVARRSGDAGRVEDLQEKIRQYEAGVSEAAQKEKGQAQVVTNTTTISSVEAGAFSRTPGQRDTRLTCIISKGTSLRPPCSGSQLEEDSCCDLDLESQRGEESLAIAAEVAPSKLELEEDLKQQITEDLRKNAPVALVVGSEKEDNDKRRKALVLSAAGLCLMLFVAVAVGIGVALRPNNEVNTNPDKNVSANVPTNQVSPAPTAAITSTDSELVSITMAASKTIEEIRQRQNLRCGVSVFNATSGRYEGLYMDLCRAVAAAILGDPELVEPFLVRPWTRFPMLHNGLVDPLAEPTTHAMGREFREPMTNASFAFTVPYCYTGMAFGGDPHYLDCAERLDSTSEACSNLTICVAQCTTYQDILAQLFAPQPVQALVCNMSLATVPQFAPGKCNVMAADSLALQEAVCRSRGYTGRWKASTKLFSKDPLTLVTRTDDPTFASVVNLAVNILYSAEAQGMTQLSTTALQQLTVDLPEEFKSMVVNVVSQMGNVDTLYARDNKSRQGLNRLHTHADSTGLLYSHPFGTLQSPGGESEAGGMVETMLARGFLRCGIDAADNDDEVSKAEFHFHTEFCRALAKALFPDKTVADALEMVEILVPSDRFGCLTRGDVDVLAGERVNLMHGWREPTTGQGFHFTAPHYYKDDSCNRRTDNE